MLEIRCGEEIRLLIDEKQDDAVGWGVGVGVDVIPLFNIEFGADTRGLGRGGIHETLTNLKGFVSFFLIKSAVSKLPFLHSNFCIEN